MAALRECPPSIILTANFNPRLHVLAADGALRADGTFACLPPMPEALPGEGFRRAVLAFLVENRAITDEVRAQLLGWQYFGGFSGNLALENVQRSVGVEESIATDRGSFIQWVGRIT